MLAAHLAGALGIWLMAAKPRVPILATFHHWYPVFYVFACYKEMSILIPVLRTGSADAALAKLDYAIWGANPTVWLERFHNPAIAEILQIIYSGFVPAVLGVAFILWKKKRFKEFR